MKKKTNNKKTIKKEKKEYRIELWDKTILFMDKSDLENILDLIDVLENNDGEISTVKRKEPHIEASFA